MGGGRAMGDAMGEAAYGCGDGGPAAQAGVLCRSDTAGLPPPARGVASAEERPTRSRPKVARGAATAGNLRGGGVA